LRANRDAPVPGCFGAGGAPHHGSGGLADALGTSAAAAVRGVAPGDQVKYAPVVGDDGVAAFRCLGASGEVSGPLLPFVAVNDDFCDCIDGSDEPGTGACAGQKETLFYCPNEHSNAAYIYASHVNDGICDCCDGSDEWQSAVGTGRTPCRNTCVQEGRELMKERQRKEADLRSGLKQRRVLVEAARSAQRKAAEALEQLRLELPSFEAKEKEAAAELEAARQADNDETERRKAADASAAAGDESPVGSSAGTAGEVGRASEVAVAEAGTEAGAGGSASEGGPVVSEYAKWMDGAGEAAAAAGTDGAPPSATETGSGEAPAEGKVISEYTKWMEGASEALGESGSEEAPAPAEEAAEEDGEDLEVGEDLEDRSTGTPSDEEDGGAEEEEEDEQGGSVLGRVWQRFRDTVAWPWRKLFGKAASGGPLSAVVERATEAHKAAKKKVEESREKIKELEKKAQNTDGEDLLAYSGLDSRCITKKLAEYKYEVCFFSTAKQDSTSIGRWKGWEAPGVGLFEGGQYCPGGPERSLKVRFTCGPNEDIVDLGEPSRCTYEATLVHPGACSEDLLKAFENPGPRMPTDEL